MDGTPKGVGPMSPGDSVNAWMDNSEERESAY